MVIPNMISVFPTYRCGNNCKYCLLNKNKVSCKKLSIDELAHRLSIIIEIIERDYRWMDIEFLLGDDEQNFDPKITNQIVALSKKIPIQIAMNDVDYEFSTIICARHITSIDNLPKKAGQDFKTFVVTEDNFKSLTPEILTTCRFNTMFIIDSALQSLEVKDQIIKYLTENGVLMVGFSSKCLNMKGLNFDVFADSGLIALSCSKKITHIIGHVDFENKKFIITKTHCDKDCKLI